MRSDEAYNAREPQERPCRCDEPEFLFRAVAGSRFLRGHPASIAASRQESDETISFSYTGS
jgi:hypothetical protein